jgi:transcription elongation factor Elf1
MSIPMSKWIEILKALESNPKIVIPCPGCGKANLEVIDVNIGNKIERWIHCPACKERTAALKSS